MLGNGVVDVGVGDPGYECVGDVDVVERAALVVTPPGDVGCVWVKVRYDGGVCWGCRVDVGAEQVCWCWSSCCVDSLRDLCRCMCLEVPEYDDPG